MQNENMVNVFEAIYTILNRLEKGLDYENKDFNTEE